MKEKSEILIENIRRSFSGTPYTLDTSESFIKSEKRDFITIKIRWLRGMDLGVPPVERLEWIQFDENTLRVRQVSDPEAKIIVWLLQTFFKK